MTSRVGKGGASESSGRLAAGRLTVVDATNVQREARQPLVKLAREYHTLPVAIVFNLPENICQERNRDRSDRDFGPHVIRQQRSQLAVSRGDQETLRRFPDAVAVIELYLDRAAEDAHQLLGELQRAGNPIRRVADYMRLVLMSGEGIHGVAGQPCPLWVQSSFCAGHIWYAAENLGNVS